MPKIESTGASVAGQAILVVEDEFFIADELVGVLAEAGAQVIGPAATLDHAEDLIAAHRVDLAVLDINLRGRSVFPLADSLRDLNIPFVFATGYDRASLPARFRGVPHWEKPFDVGVLAAALPAARGGA